VSSVSNDSLEDDGPPTSIQVPVVEAKPVIPTLQPMETKHQDERSKKLLWICLLVVGLAIVVTGATVGGVVLGRRSSPVAPPTVPPTSLPTSSPTISPTEMPRLVQSDAMVECSLNIGLSCLSCMNNIISLTPVSRCEFVPNEVCLPVQQECDCDGCEV